MKNLRYLLVLFVLIINSYSSKAQDELSVELPSIILADVEYTIPFEIKDSAFFNLDRKITVNSNAAHATTDSIGNGELLFTFSSADEKFNMAIGKHQVVKDVSPIPLLWSIVPPLLAILLAFVLKEVLSALLIGIFTGSAIIQVYSDGSFFGGIWKGFLRVIDHYIISALNNSDHLTVIVFSLLIGAVVSVISFNGGMNALVGIISRKAKDAKSGQFATWLMGIMIFFDDYANTLVVGKTMRPLTDRLRISREKLAYIVDSTAAPIAAVAFVTTWIGAELTYIAGGVEQINKQGTVISESTYSIFLSSLSYSFYPILTLLFILFLIFQQKDFGPMYKAEVEARKRTTPLSEEESTEDETTSSPSSLWLSLIPIIIIVFGTLLGIITTGWAEVGMPWAEMDGGFIKKIGTIIGEGSSYSALLWSSLSALTAAILLTVFVGKKDFKETIHKGVDGVKTMLESILILTLAWSLAQITEDLKTAEFISGHMEGMAPGIIPFIVFIMSALVAFATGSSWGTMAILYPLVLTSTWKLCITAGMTPDDIMPIFYNCTACVLAGAVLGDHCSPISDTTILSSMASSCDHLAHVRTQLPYALTVGGIGCLICTIPSGFGLHPFIALILGVAAAWFVVKKFGKKVESV